MSHVAPLRAPDRPKPVVSVERRVDGTLVLSACSVDAAVAERRLHIDADTPVRIQVTPDSTGLPKGVLITHGNLAASAELQAIVAGGSG